MTLYVVQRIAVGFLVVVLVFNMTQRAHQAHGEKKRIASLHWAMPFLIMYLSSLLIRRSGASPALLWLAGLLAVAFVVLFREKLLVFRTRCVSCNQPLPIKRVLYYDANQCASCAPDSGRDVKLR
jgi:CDP-diglyceride synthetase